jgi:hypothetical protein
VHPCKPEAPNFLRVEEGSEAEKVDLRHEVVNDPKVALRKAVKRLARADVVLSSHASATVLVLIMMFTVLASQL